MTPPVPRQPPVPRNRILWFVGLVSLGLACDLFSKHAVFSSLGYPHQPPLHRPELPGDWLLRLFGGAIKFRLYTSFNRGALWGLGQGFTAIFAIVSVIAAGGILYWLFWGRAAHSLWLTVSLGSIMAGTLGNLYDRLGWHGYVDPLTNERYYAVRDFLHFRLGSYDWPVFNFADVFLVTGAVMLVVYSFWTEGHGSQAPPETVAASESATGA